MGGTTQAGDSIEDVHDDLLRESTFYVRLPRHAGLDCRPQTAPEGLDCHPWLTPPVHTWRCFSCETNTHTWSWDAGAES